MKTNLAYINDAAESQITSATGPKTTRHVGGFPIAYAAPRPTHWESYRKSYRETAETALAHLAAVGITPLAVLPRQWWKTMVDETGLIRMNPDESGRVHCDLTGVAKEAHGENVDRWIWAIAISGLVTGFALTYAGLLQYTDWYYIATCIISGIVGVVSMIIGGCMASEFKPLANAIARVNARTYVRKHGRAALLKRVINDQRGDSSGVKVTLPPAPDDVLDILSRFTGYRGEGSLKVAAEAGAISLEKPLDQLIFEKMRTLREEAREAERAAALDPIVYLECGPCAIIIAQFGDFPMERELVDRVMTRQTFID